MNATVPEDSDRPAPDLVLGELEAVRHQDADAVLKVCREPALDLAKLKQALAESEHVH